MARILPVKMATSSRALWFDANGIEAAKGEAVIVQTARGTEFGTVADPAFEATPEQLSSLKSPLKPVCRIATEQDIQKAEELKARAIDIMPAYREMVEEEGLDMRPISVEFLFDGDKAVFYFEADDRVDFRELVRKLASRFKVRVDMRQIGPRDEARMIGGIGHCGQELCCKRLGGEFCPVSIRMAKEQDLSLNPQKISGICGRLMCCLRYEYDAYKDFKGRAPKMGAKIETPDGVGKVISLDVPKEMVTIQVEADKKISVPLDDMSKSSQEGTRPDTVDKEAWARATNKEELSVFGDTTFVTSQFTSEDKLGEAKAVHREASGKKEKRRGQSGQGKEAGASPRSSRRDRDKAKSEVQTLPARKPRRRSTKLASGENAVEALDVQMSGAQTSSVQARNGSKDGERSESRRSRTRRSRGQVVIPASENHRGASYEVASRDNAQKQHSNQETRSAKRGAANAGDRPDAQGVSAEHRRRRRSNKPSDQSMQSERSGRSQDSRDNYTHRGSDADVKQGSCGKEQTQTPSSRAQGSHAQGSDIRPGRRSSGLRQHAEDKMGSASSSNASGAMASAVQKVAGDMSDSSGATGSAPSGSAASNSAKADEHRSNRRRPRKRKPSASNASNASDAPQGSAGNNGANAAARDGSHRNGAKRRDSAAREAGASSAGGADAGRHNDKNPGRNSEKGE